MAWFNMVKRRQVSPGAQAYAHSGWREAKTPLYGAATATLARYRVWQPPQTPNGLNVPVDGLGGAISGQIVGQPLFNLDTDGVATGTLF